MNTGFAAQVAQKFGEFQEGRNRQGHVEYKVHCPFCLRKGLDSALRKYKLSLNPEKGGYHCFRCDSHGRLADLMDYRFDRSQYTGYTPTQELVAATAPGDLLPINAVDPSTPARYYLETVRGFDVDALFRWFNVCVCGAGGQTYGNSVDFFFDTSGTIVFPVIMDKQVVGWQCRTPYEPDALTEEECAGLGMPVNPEDGLHIRPPKYLTDPRMHKAMTLFNYDQARTSRLAVLSEGALDVAGVGVCGLCAFGKSYSAQQVRLIKANWQCAVVLLDPEGTSVETANLVLSLSLAMPTVRVDLKGVGDPGDAAFSNIWQQIADAAHAAGVDIRQYVPEHWNAAITRTKDRR